MCVILMVLKKENNEKLNKIIKQNVYDYSNGNRDGLSILAMKRKESEALSYRGIDYDYNKIVEAIDNYDFLNFHFRMATKGEKSVDNCHLWHIGNWIFSHNGTIYKMGSEKVCDSKDFFETLFSKGFLSKKPKKNKINYEAIQKYMRDSSYTGRSVIYNTATNKAYLFGDFRTFALDKNYLAICSTEVEVESYFNLFNVNFETEVESEIEKLEVELDGVHLIDYQKEKLYQLADKLEWGSYHNSKSKNSGKVIIYDDKGNEEVIDDDPIDPFIGKRLSEMTDDEIELYYQTQGNKIAE